MIKRELFSFSSEVESALAAREPVVALESTVIAHGLPRPQNFETARRLEQIVKSNGAVPATIAILEGKICVGLSDEQTRFIAENDQVRKVSIRDLPVAVARRWNGATTVASTIRIAHAAAISIFATGGIGGVHRGALNDISADLPELTRTPVVVVCSGAKTVLDLPATREWLETHGVTVVGYACDEMAGFYSQQSGLAIDVRADSPREVLELVNAQRALGIESAMLVTVPIPKAVELPSDVLDQLLNEALDQSQRDRVSGRDLTPFLLSRMALNSEGATLRANIALLENNARVAAEIAKRLER
jgi:pseudouridine-5'-phosphate glycosidase